MGRVFRTLGVTIAFTLAFALSTGAQNSTAEARRHYLRAQRAMKVDNYKVAADELRAATRLAPKNAVLSYDLGIVLKHQNMNADATRALRKAIQLGLPADKEVKAKAILQELSLADEKPDAPAKGQDLTASSTQDSNLSPVEKEARFHYKIALTAVHDNDLPIAEHELEKAAELAPNNALVLYNLAIVQSKTGRPTEALTVLKRAIQLGLPSEQAKTTDDLLVRWTYESEKGIGALSWLEGTWKADLDNRVDLRSQISCTYFMHSIFTLTIKQDAEHPDNLIGQYVYDALGFRIDSGRRPGQARVGDAVAYCTSQFGSPDQVKGHAAYKITDIKQDSDQPDSIVLSAFQNSCEGYCNQYLTLQAYPMDLEKDFECVLKRLDDQHLELEACRHYSADPGGLFPGLLVKQ